MKDFTFKQEELTEQQRAAIAAAEKSAQEQIARLEKEEEDRAERYYNCEDDYSWGGLCSKANYIERDRVRRNLAETIEEIVRGGYLVREYKYNILRDITTGEVVSSILRYGRYGYFYSCTDGRCISNAKKIDTFKKKGVCPYVVTQVVKVKRNGYWRNGDARYEMLGLISSTEEISAEVVYVDGTPAMIQ